MHPVIRIEEEHEDSLSLTNSEIPGRRHAAILNLKQTHACILNAAYNSGAIVCRPIIYNYYIQFAMALIQNGPDCHFDVLSLIENRNDD